MVSRIKDPMSDRETFLAAISSALGNDRIRPPDSADDSALVFSTPDDVRKRAKGMQEEALMRSEELCNDLEQSARAAGWIVSWSKTQQDIADYVSRIAHKIETKLVVKSNHKVLDSVVADPQTFQQDVVIETMNMAGNNIDVERESLRQTAIRAGLGVTGVNYAIAETGSVVLLAGKELSRLVSLLPPVHIAVVEKSKVLPSLDELFMLRRVGFDNDSLGSYMNIITGPSRSADIEQTLVTGVHGPREVHMILH